MARLVWRYGWRPACFLKRHEQKKAGTQSHNKKEQPKSFFAAIQLENAGRGLQREELCVQAEGVRRSFPCAAPLELGTAGDSQLQGRQP